MIGGASDVIGACSACGGAVIASRVSWTAEAPPPSCESCGHVPRKRVVNPMIASMPQYYRQMECAA